MLIGFFTNRDIFLNKLIPLLSVYLDQTKACITLLQKFQQSPSEHRSQKDVQSITAQFDSTFNMAQIILKELKSIHSANIVGSEDKDLDLMEQQSSQSSSSQPDKTDKVSQEEQFKRYRHLSIADKARVLIDLQELKQIEQMLEKRQLMAK